MQFRKSTESLAGSVPARVSGYPRKRRSQWLIDWIQERGHYVRLACGHLESFADADTSLCLIQTFPGIEILCEKCEQFSKVEKSISLFEYMDIDKPVYSPAPLF